MDQLRWKTIGHSLAVLLFWVLGAQAQDTTTGLVGYWKLNDSGTTATDSSGLAHHGTLLPVGGEPVWAAGQVGGSILLNGVNGRIAVPHHADFNITGQITIAAWVRRTNDTTIDSILGFV